jgi:hypothetical protein
VTQFADFRRIFGALLEDAGDPADSQHETIEKIVSQLAQFGVMTRDTRDLVDVLERDQKLLMIEQNRYIYLKPIPAGIQSIVPIVSLDIDFTQTRPRVHMTAAMFVLNASGQLSGIGMRFETPEGDGGGHHDFHHAQLVREIGRRISLPNCPLWLPDKQPSFPMDAEDPVELLVCTIASIYGARKIAQLRRHAQAIWTYARRMRLAPALTRNARTEPRPGPGP